MKEQTRNPEQDIINQLLEKKLSPEEYVVAVKAQLFGTSQEMGERFLTSKVFHERFGDFINELGVNFKKAIFHGFVDPYTLIDPFKEFVKSYYHVNKYAMALHKATKYRDHEVVALFRKQGIPIKWNENRKEYEIDDLAAQAMAIDFVNKMKLKVQKLQKKFAVQEREVAKDVAGAFHFMTGNIEAFTKWLIEELQVWLSEVAKLFATKGFKMPEPSEKLLESVVKEVEIDKPTGEQAPELDLTQTQQISPAPSRSVAPASPSPGGPGMGMDADEEEVPEVDLTQQSHVHQQPSQAGGHTTQPVYQQSFKPGPKVASPKPAVTPRAPNLPTPPSPISSKLPVKLPSNFDKLPKFTATDAKLANSAISKIGGNLTFGKFAANMILSSLKSNEDSEPTKAFNLAVMKSADMGASCIESVLGVKLPRTQHEEEVMKVEQQLDTAQEREVMMEPKHPKPPAPG